MSVRIGNASIDENGKSHGGKAGDQTGKEVLIKKFYVHKKGWDVIRAKDPITAARIADAMEHACANDLIGYDQYERDTLLKKSAAVKYDPEKVTSACECDCSSLVRVCIAYAYGIDKVDTWRRGARFSTANMKTILLGSGQFDGLPDDVGKSDKKVRRGDILCTKTQGHCAVVLDDGPDAEYAPGDVQTDDCPYSKPDCTISRYKNRKASGVKWIQWHLNMLMPGEPKLDEDGIFGKLTEATVRNFQRDSGIKVDGIVGPVTCRTLVTEYEILRTGGLSEIGPEDEIDNMDDGISEDDGIAEPHDGHYVDSSGVLGMTPEEAAEVAAELARAEREGT